MRLTLFALCAVLMPGLAAARDWKVSDVPKDAAAPEMRLLLNVDKSRISVRRESDRTVLQEIAPADIVSIWYDDRAIRSYAREWWDSMDRVCREWCGGEDITVPLTLMAIGGAGYLAALPFEQDRHFVNIQYRHADSFDVLTLRTNWFDHFWLMTDLSQAIGRKWLNIPQQRAKIFWSWADRTQTFDWGAMVGETPIGGEHHVLLWEDGRGRGVLMLFKVQQSGSPALTLADAVTVEKAEKSAADPAYCRVSGGAPQLLSVKVGNKRAELRSADKACRILWGPAAGNGMTALVTTSE
jgi:hypothetical protein